MVGQIQRLVELQSLNKPVEIDPNVKILSFMSLKGGTGRSVLSLNVANQISLMGYRVLLVDFNLSNPNLHILSNHYPELTIHDYLDGKCLFEEMIQKIDSNFSVIFGKPGELESGKKISSSISTFLRNLLVSVNEYDLILFDTPAGINNVTLQLSSISNGIVITGSPEPTSVMDSYLLTKFLLGNGFDGERYYLVNKCNSIEEGKTAFGNLSKALNHFLKVTVTSWGIIPNSDQMYRSIMSQELLSESFSNSEITGLIQRLSTQFIKILQVANNRHRLSASC